MQMRRLFVNSTVIRYYNSPVQAIRLGAEATRRAPRNESRPTNTDPRNGETRSTDCYTDYTDVQSNRIARSNDPRLDLVQIKSHAVRRA